MNTTVSASLTNVPMPLRTRAKVVQTHPWYTRDLLERMEWNEDWKLLPELTSFFPKLKAFEHNIFTGQTVLHLSIHASLQFTAYEATNDIARQALNINNALQSNHPNAPTYVCALFTALRLADIMLLLHRKGLVTARNFKLTGRPPSQWKHWGHLGNVKTILQTFSNRFNTRNSRPELNAVMSDPILLQLRSLADVCGKVHWQKIQRNLLIASLGLCFLWSGAGLRLGSHLPPGIEGFLESRRTQLTEDQYSTLNGLLRKSTSSGMRRPLQICLHISPLAVLLDLNLDTQVYSEGAILEDSISIGTHNYPILVNVEQQIWAAIIKIARGQTTAARACHDLYHSMPWRDIDDIGANHAIITRFAILSDRPRPSIQKGPALSPVVNGAPIVEGVATSAEFASPSPACASEPITDHRDSADAQADAMNQKEKPVAEDDEMDNEEEQESNQKQNETQEDDDMREDSEAVKSSGEKKQPAEENNGEEEEEEPKEKKQAAEEDQEDEPVEEPAHRRKCVVPEGMEEDQDGDGEEEEEEEEEEDQDGDGEEDEEQNADGQDEQGEDEDDKDADGEDELEESGSDEQDKCAASDDMEENEESTTRQRGVLLTSGRRTKKNLRVRIMTPPGTGSSPSPPRKNKRRRPESSSGRDLKSNVMHAEERKHLRAPTPFADAMNAMMEDTKDLQVKGPITLDVESPGEKIQATTTWTLFDAKGSPHEYRPAVHHKSTLTLFEGILKAVESKYRNGLPRHAALSVKAQSVFTVVSHEDMKAMSHLEKLELFRKGHILETDRPVVPFKFDKVGICSLGRPRQVISVQDQSIKPSTNQSDHIRQGTLAQILESSRADGGGKVLNALDFPLPLAQFSAGDLATDAFAWNLAAVNVEGELAVYPFADMKWGLCGTSGASSTGHQEPDGLPVVMDVMTGAKWWIVFRPKGSKDFRVFASISQFLSGHFDIDKPTCDLWDIEAVLLTPGTRLYMRPNTVHAVFTPEHSICHGGHFYATSTMQDTFYGVVHSFCANMFITNTSHPETRILLRRIVQLYHMGLARHEFDEDEPVRAHIPDLKSMNSVLDLASACNLAILSNALDFRTYTHPNQTDDKPLTDKEKLQMDMYDLNSMPESDRAGCVYARGLALDLFDWFSDNYVLIGKRRSGSMSTLSALMNNLAHQAYAIWLTKELAVAREVVGAPNCTPERLRQQLDNFLPVQAREFFTNLLENRVKMEKMYMDWTGWKVKPIEKSNAPNAPGPNKYTRTPEDIWLLGMSASDEKYAKGIAAGFAVDSSDGTSGGRATKKRRRN